MRTYERTHSWISFDLDLRRIPYALWAALGECKSKCEHIAGVPLRPDTREKLHRVYLAKGVQGTTAIEGNTLTLEQVRQQVEGELRVPPSQEYLQAEISNIIRECNRVNDLVKSGELPELAPATVKGFNREVLDDLEYAREEGVHPGQFRHGEVRVGRYNGAPAKDCQYLVERLCEWLAGEGFAVGEDLRLIVAIIKAVLAHLYIAWIHPFGDGNGRTARLVEFQILLTSGVPAPAAQLLSNHYNQTRSEYLRQLDFASKSGGDVIPFLSYAVTGFLDGLREQLAYIHTQQLDVAWRNYIHESFRNRRGNANDRRRHLALDVSRVGRSVSKRDIRSLTPRLAEAYVGKDDKTISRDLNVLVEMGLVVPAGGEFRAKTEVMSAFIPVRAVGS